MIVYASRVYYPRFCSLQPLGVVYRIEHSFFGPCRDACRSPTRFRENPAVPASVLPEVLRRVTHQLLPEVRMGMSAFPDSQHICSWAGLSPGNNESAGKRKSAHINKGNPYLKSMLCEVGWVISGKRTLYLSGWYWRVKQRKGAKRATIALARKLLTLIYTMLKTGIPYNEECFEIRRKQSERKRAGRMVNELQKLGYFVVAPD